MTTPDVGVIGLGELGLPLSHRLAATPWTVAVLDTNPERVSAALTAGAGRTIDGTDGVIWRSKVLFGLLPDSETTLAVIRSADPSGLAGTTVIDMCSGDPGMADTLTDLVAQLGGSYLAATVLRGGGHEAGNGQLNLALGGRADVLQHARQAIDRVGRVVAEFASPAQAQAVKLANNFLALSASALLAEAVGVAERAGVSRSDCLRYLRLGTAANWLRLEQAEKVADQALSRTTAAGFRATLAEKDLRYFTGLAARGGRATVGAAVHGVYAEAQSSGNGATEAGTWPWRRLSREERSE